jgi:hypothetical protein
MALRQNPFYMLQMVLHRHYVSGSIKHAIRELVLEGVGPLASEPVSLPGY